MKNSYVSITQIEEVKEEYVRESEFDREAM